jgi:hypothetical protein
VGGERREGVADLLDRAGRVPAIGALGDGPERLAPARPADEDRQVGLDRPGLADRVVECVDGPVVRDALPVEEPSQQHDRLVEAIEPFAESRAEVDAEGVVLALEPRPADAQHGPAVADVVEGRRELGGQAGVAERVGPDHQAQPNARGQRAEPGKGRPALEDRLFPRAEDRKQVIPCPDAVPVGVLGCQGSVPEGRPVGRLGPELEPEPHADGSPGLSRGARGRDRSRSGS